jgi:endoglucanase
MLKYTVALASSAYGALITAEQLPLRTSGSSIVDSAGSQVRLGCVNWYGAHMDRYVVDGLDEVPLSDLAQDIADKGFNCVRLVHSLEQYVNNPVVADEAVAANPDFKGLTSMEIFDKTVEALTDAGVMVIINNHISDAEWCCSTTDRNGLWHNNHYTAD